MKILAILILLVFAARGADKSADAVKAAEKSWASATVAGDEAALKQILADDLTYTHSSGDTDTKAIYIDNLKSGARKYLKVNYESTDVRIYGNTAVLSATAQIETNQKGGATNAAHLRFIHVWVNQGGKWQLVAHQSLRLQN